MLRRVSVLDQAQLDNLIVSLIPSRMPGAYLSTVEAQLAERGHRVDLAPFGPVMARLVESSRVVLRGGKTKPFQLVKGVQPCAEPTQTLTDQGSLL